MKEKVVESKQNIWKSIFEGMCEGEERKEVCGLWQWVWESGHARNRLHWWSDMRCQQQREPRWLLWVQMVHQIECEALKQMSRQSIYSAGYWCGSDKP